MPITEAQYFAKYSPCGRYVAIGDDGFKIVDRDSGETVHHCTDKAYNLIWSERIATSYDKSIRLYDKEFNLVSCYTHDDVVFMVGFSPSCDRLAFSDMKSTLYIYHDTGRIEEYATRISAADWSKYGLVFTRRNNIFIDKDADPSYVIDSHHHITDISWSSKGLLACLCGKRVYVIGSKTLLYNPRGLPFGKYIDRVFTDGGRPLNGDVVMETNMYHFAVVINGVLNMKWSPDGRHIVTYDTYGKMIQVWSGIDRIINMRNIRKGCINIEFSPDGSEMMCMEKDDVRFTVARHIIYRRPYDNDVRPVTVGILDSKLSSDLVLCALSYLGYRR